MNGRYEIAKGMGGQSSEAGVRKGNVHQQQQVKPKQSRGVVLDIQVQEQIPPSGSWSLVGPG